MKRAVLILLFLTPLVWGEKPLPFEFKRQFLHKSEKITVQSEKVGLEDASVKVYHGKSVIFQRKNNLLETRVIKLNFVSPLLFLFWKTGNHGESLVVLDVERKKVVWEEFSTWPIELTVEKDKVRIDYTGQELKEDKYEEFTKVLYL